MQVRTIQEVDEAEMVHVPLSVGAFPWQCSASHCCHCTGSTKQRRASSGLPLRHYERSGDVGAMVRSMAPTGTAWLSMANRWCSPPARYPGRRKAPNRRLGHEDSHPNKDGSWSPWQDQLGKEKLSRCRVYVEAMEHEARPREHCKLAPA